MKKSAYMLSIGLLILVSAVASRAWATEYYVDQANAGASDQNAGTAALPWKTITKANQTLIAGDTVYIKAGTYSTYIAPNNSGAASRPITYRNYSSDVVTVSNAAYAVYLNGKSYITVQGIKGSNNTAHLWITGTSAHHNIIDGCTFSGMSGGGWTGSAVISGAHHNWIRNSNFNTWGTITSSAASGSVLDIGSEETTDNTNYNLVENCTIYHGGHQVIGLYGQYNTLRNNYFYNNAWYGGYGYRIIYAQGPDAGSGHNIIEGNRVGYADQCRTADLNSDGMDICTSNNLIRYNNVFYNYGSGIALSIGGSGYISNINYNKLYNNTLFHNGYNSYSPDPFNSAIAFLKYGTSYVVKYNQIKNNLIKYHGDQTFGYSGTSASDQTFANNYDADATGKDPLFVNATATEGTPTDTSYPNLSLQAGSPAINYGTYLTTASGAGTNATSLVVADASYFQDGTYAPEGAMQADWIAVGTTTNVVQISSISGNTLTLAGPISWTAGAPVWLYKKSDGARVLYGTAPDAGAYEYTGQVIRPVPPPAVQVTVP